MVERFSIDMDGSMSRDDGGYWIRFVDCEELEAENAKLRAQASPFSHSPMVSTCKRCGRADGLDCVVSDAEWERIGGKYSTLCLWCMDEIAAQLGIGIRGARLHFCGSAITAESESATLCDENAKLRDLLRRVQDVYRHFRSAAVIVREFSKLLPEIKSAIEPGNPGELGENPGMLADIDQEELTP